MSNNIRNDKVSTQTFTSISVYFGYLKNVEMQQV